MLISLFILSLINLFPIPSISNSLEKMHTTNYIKSERIYLTLQAHPLNINYKFHTFNILMHTIYSF